MVNEFQKRGYDRPLIEQQIDKANLQEREQLLKEQKKKKKRQCHNYPFIAQKQKHQTLVSSIYKHKPS